MITQISRDQFSCDLDNEGHEIQTSALATEISQLGLDRPPIIIQLIGEWGGVPDLSIGRTFRFNRRDMNADETAGWRYLNAFGRELLIIND